ncbi:MAG TPA: tetratricopeptide repeat protein [Bacteroidia bacterium]|nr:tetratricopeptide repeat protein [Bacteroidia bacterium]
MIHSHSKKSKSRPLEKKGSIQKNERKKLKLGLIIALLGCLLYSNTIHHGYVLDDFSAIKENNIVRQGFNAIPEIFKTSYRQGYLSVQDGLYRPLSLAMYAIEWNFFPDQPGVSHFINIVLYGLTGLVLFFFLCELTKGNELFSFLATLLFIAHPLHVEIVANIKSRDELLCFLFAISSFWLILRHVESVLIEEKKKAKSKKRLLFLSLLFFFFSFLSKETTIVCLAIIPVMLHFFKGISIKQNIYLLIPFILVTVVYMALRFYVLHGAIADSNVSISDNILAGAKTISTRLGTAFYILGLYVLKLFFPHPLSYDYSFNQIPIVGMGNVFSILSLLFYLLMAGYSAYMILKSFKKDNTKCESNLVVFGIVYFIVTIFLFSNLVLIIGTSMGDRLMYFPSLGFCIIITALYMQYFVKNKNELSFTNWKLYPMIAILIAFSLKTYSRNYDWKNNYTLYTHDVQLVPNSVKAHYYLGLELVKIVAEGEPDQQKKNKIYEQGISELEKAIAILPSFSGAYTQLGVAYYRLRNYEKAIENYNKAATLSPSDAITLNNIGTIYFEWKKYTEAKEKFQQALAIDPRFVDAHMNLGSVLGQTGDYKNAINSFQNAIMYAPDNAQAHYFIGITYANLKDKENADKYFQAAEKLNPAFKHP